ncbi:glycoside hydrolase family 15 protein [Plantactinospora sp. BB1]|uniref:glycoside hydrolase family 15 protein n=1 Tax=Plantactinospora sp. BB1 TaxID=2071627 RepID=UPI001F453042|nr:glycoside hydrolase family 15 protein [Plantactinospora sp. BB1]
MRSGDPDEQSPTVDRRQPGPYALREYALLADGHRGALVDPAGNVSWLCAPHWDSPAVFSSLLGGAGHYSIVPTDPRFVWGGYYEPDSLIWTSRWVGTDGIIEYQEALAFPADPSRLVLLRRIRTLGCPIRLSVWLEPRANFGREPLRDLRTVDGSWTARTGPLHLRFTADAPFRPVGDGALEGVLSLPAGGRHDLVLEVSTAALDQRVPDPDETWRTTEHAWRSAAVPLTGCLARRDARFAHALLRGMTRPGGGLVAAATTSLPERARAGRNYDYRYAWIRDQCYAGRAAATAGDHNLLDGAVAFIRDRLLADGARTAPAYTVAGAPIPAQEALPWLPGYPGGTVHTGNLVRDQFQLDVFGECLLLLAEAARRQRLDLDGWRAVETAVEVIGRRWREPDSGMWELEPRQWTHSKLTCVAGLRAVARLAPAAQAGRWAGLADAVLADTGRHGVHPSGRWRRCYDDDRVDAALLLPVIRGAVPASDPRAVATRHAVLDTLAEDTHLYRFRPDERPLGHAEGAFLLCGFLAALAAHQAGDPVGAARWFERNRSGCGSPGLYSEEYDVPQRLLRGNLPQAFVHALLLETAVTLSDAAGDADRR